MRTHHTLSAVLLSASCLLGQSDDLARADALREAADWNALLELAERHLAERPGSLDWAAFAATACYRLDRRARGDELKGLLLRRLAELDALARNQDVARSRSGAGGKRVNNTHDSSSAPDGHEGTGEGDGSESRGGRAEASDPGRGREAPASTAPATTRREHAADEEHPAGQIADRIRSVPLPSDVSQQTGGASSDPTEPDDDGAGASIGEIVDASSDEEIEQLDPKDLGARHVQRAKPHVTARLLENLHRLQQRFGASRANEQLIGLLERPDLALERWQVQDAREHLAILAARQDSAEVLRICGAALLRWAAAIDLNPSERERLAFAATLDDMTKLHANGKPGVRALLEGVLTKLRASRSDALRAAAAERLVAWSQLRLDGARADVDREDLESAAEQFRAAHRCDPSNEDALLRAAELFAGLGQLRQAVPIWKQLVAEGTSPQCVAAAQQQLERLQDDARARLAEGVPVPRANADSLSKQIEWVEQEMPVLFGDELEALRSLVERKMSSEAQREWLALVERLRGDGIIDSPRDAVVEPEPVAAGSLRVASIGLDLRPVAGTDLFVSERMLEEPMLYRLREARVPDFENKAMATWISYDEAQWLCDELNRREQQADRLPPGYSYQIPTQAELAEVRDADGRLAFAGGVRVWISDPCPSFGSERYRLCMRVERDERDGGYHRASSWEEGTGALIVLVRR